MKNYLLFGALFSSVTLFSQIGINTDTPRSTLDVVGKATDTSSLDGITAPRLTGDQLRAKTYTTAQTGALVYVTSADTAPAGQTIDVITTGYYYFNGTRWVPGSGVDTNIYNANGTLLSQRTLTQAGNSLTFTNTQKTTFSNSVGTGIMQDSGSGNRASIGLSNNGSTQLWMYTDTNAASQILAVGNSTSLVIGTNATTNPTPLTFVTSMGAGLGGSERARITPTGNLGIAIGSPTEKLDNNGITRLRVLPLNGSTNAINTNSSGNLSAAQDQTFTATRTVVADGNGVLGYVAGIPSDAGSSKVLVIANASGTQNVGGQFIPNAAIGQFTNESLDIYNAWTNNVFTVPANMGGIYIIVMQNSNSHVSTGSATPTWHTMAYYEKSTDGGTNWNTMIKHTYADLAGTIVDNGNTLYWTGFLNAGDQIRVRFSCNATTNNIVNYGGLSITKLAQ
ncbi:hypothetical protein [Chryseobacterium tongliaoense]|uniref:hypothetical protein n=1 Tax=Chryseobacterium tongliaoense TaxID=3240933 RepID=UPI0035195EA5